MFFVTNMVRQEDGRPVLKHVWIVDAFNRMILNAAAEPGKEYLAGLLAIERQCKALDEERKELEEATPGNLDELDAVGDCQFVMLSLIGLLEIVVNQAKEGRIKPEITEAKTTLAIMKMDQAVKALDEREVRKRYDFLGILDEVCRSNGTKLLRLSGDERRDEERIRQEISFFEQKGIQAKPNRIDEAFEGSPYGIVYFTAAGNQTDASGKHYFDGKVLKPSCFEEPDLKRFLP